MFGRENDDVGPEFTIQDLASKFNLEDRFQLFRSVAMAIVVRAFLKDVFQGFGGISEPLWAKMAMQ